MAAGLGCHGAHLGIGKNAEEHQHTASDPNRQNQGCRGQRLGYQPRRQKNASPNDDAQYDGGRIDQSERPRQVRHRRGRRLDGAHGWPPSWNVVRAGE